MSVLIHSAAHLPWYDWAIVIGGATGAGGFVVGFAGMLFWGGR